MSGDRTRPPPTAAAGRGRSPAALVAPDRVVERARGTARRAAVAMTRSRASSTPTAFALGRPRAAAAKRRIMRSGLTSGRPTSIAKARQETPEPWPATVRPAALEVVEARLAGTGQLAPGGDALVLEDPRLVEHRLGLEDPVGGRGPLAVAHELGERLRAAARLDEAPHVAGAVGLGIGAAGDPRGAIARDHELDALEAHADRPHRVDDGEADRAVAARRLPGRGIGEQGPHGGEHRAHVGVAGIGS